MAENNHNFHNFHYFHQVSEEFVKAIDDNREYFKADTAVDLGAGGGSFSKIISKYAKKLYSADVSDEAIKTMKDNLLDFKNIEIIKVGDDRLPFDDSSVDLVFAANSFHDLPKGYEKEISRVLKEGGRFIDLDWKKESTEFGPPLSIRLSEEDVKRKFEAYSFKEVKRIDLSTHYMLILVA